jgi:hypothetical protein
MSFTLPSIEESTLTVKGPHGTHTIDPVDIMDMMREAGTIADKAGRPKDWKTDFTELYEKKYGYEINRTQAVLVIDECRRMTEELVKKFFPSQNSQGSTGDQSDLTLNQDS